MFKHLGDIVEGSEFSRRLKVGEGRFLVAINNMFLLECCHVFFVCIFVKAGREDFEVPETTSEEKTPENGWERKMILSLPFGLVARPIVQGRTCW